MTMTYHCQYERANRINHIINEIGIGNIVLEKYRMTSKEVQSKGFYGKYVCLTDTGITIVKSEDKQTVITMYVTTARELVRLYGGIRNVPSALRKKVDRNQSKYIREGKTIWQ